MRLSLFPLVLGVLVLAPALRAQGPRRPLGLYAVVDVENEITALQAANPTITTTQLDAGFNAFYQSLLGNPAVSGLAVRPHWDTLNPNPPGTANDYYWNLVDDAFNQAAEWNAQNPAAAPKTIQLIVTPGFGSPQWILNQIPSCDGLFQSPIVTPLSTCGKATFTGFSEGGDGDVLPLPWNPVYKSAFQTFLTVLAARYESNPLFVSIAVTGPTATSAEMSFPNDGNSANPQAQFPTGPSPSQMWIQLQTLQYPNRKTYQGTNQSFIDEWDNAIDAFGQIFSGITLVVTTDNGFPNFVGAPSTPPSAFAADCVNNPSVACAAETTILQYFMQPGVGGANGKATQDSALAAARVDEDMGPPGVKQLSQMTAQFTAPSAQVLGGSQFSTTFSKATLTEGCTSVFPPNSGDMPSGCTVPSNCITNNCVPVNCIPQACLAPGVTPASLTSFKITGQVPAADLITPEQAAYNILNVFFTGTPVASAFDATPGTAPLNFLQVYPEDFQYAQMYANAPVPVVETNGTIVLTTAQALLNMASQSLLTISETIQPFAIGGLTLPASESSGSITITLPAGVSWTASSSPNWLTITSSVTGMGNGTLSYQAATNPGADRTATITVDGYTFTVEQQTSSVSALTLIGSMPHLAAEGGWNTTFTLVNKSSATALARTSLFADPGGALTLPLLLPQQLVGSLLASSLDQSIAPNAQFVVQAAGPANVTFSEGSAQLAANGGVDGFAIFHFNPSNQEAAVPLETRTAPSYLLAFDNTNNVVTGVAIDNVSAMGGTIPIVIRDDAGNLLLDATMPLNGTGHTAFVLPTTFAQTANKRGTVEFDTPSSGRISVLGIRYTPPGTMTTIPALANVGANGGSMAHLAVNDGWQTTFVLVNSGNSATNATLNFFADNGAPLALPLTFPQATISSTSAATLTQSIPANASLWVQSTGAAAAAVQTGSAQLTTTGNVGGFVIFRYNPNGQEAIVPLETRGASTYFIAFDNTAGTATGIAIANASGQSISVPVILRDDMGATLTTGSIALNANGHTSFGLSQLFPQAANVRGTVEFDAPLLGTTPATISVLGIRSPPVLTFTTLPALAK